MKAMNTAVDQLITRPYQAYRNTALNNKKLACIKKATACNSLARQADDIANVVDRERKLPLTTLRNAICKEARIVLKDLLKENASLKAQVHKLTGTGKGKGKGKPDFCSKGSTAGRASKSNTKNRETPPGQETPLPPRRKSKEPRISTTSPVGGRRPPQPAKASRTACGGECTGGLWVPPRPLSLCPM